MSVQSVKVLSTETVEPASRAFAPGLLNAYREQAALLDTVNRLNNEDGRVSPALERVGDTLLREQAELLEQAAACEISDLSEAAALLDLWVAEALGSADEADLPATDRIILSVARWIKHHG